MGRRLRSRIDSLYPDVNQTVQNKLLQRKLTRDGTGNVRVFAVGDKVIVKNFNSGHTSCSWLLGIVSSITGPLSYAVELNDGRMVRRHVDHIRRRCYESDSVTTVSSDFYLPDISSHPEQSVSVSPSETVSVRSSDSYPLLRCSSSPCLLWN